MHTSNAGIALIKEFEGFSPTTYTCPAGVLTIGYGHTGPDVRPGRTITPEQGEELLRLDLREAEAAVTTMIEAPLNQLQFDALVSFTFNLGGGALAGSTLRRRLNSHTTPAATVVREELPKWVHGGGGEELPGLVRRRQAEIDLFCKQPASEPQASQALGPVGAVAWIDGAHLHLRATRDTILKKSPIDSHLLPEDQKHPVAAGHTLQGVVIKHDGSHQGLLELSDAAGQWWLFDAHWTATELQAPAKTGTRLAVPYQSQRDNYRDASRTCFSSSCAMALMTLKPGAIHSDDDYIRELFKHGDSTDPGAQLMALKAFGLPATFRKDGSLDDLRSQLDAGKPVPIGILHHGPAAAPCGGGHWICITGYQQDAAHHGGGFFWVNDPWGELDHTSGVYSSTNGASLQYSYQMISQRWTVASPHDGWYIRF